MGEIQSETDEEVFAVPQYDSQMVDEKTKRLQALLRAVDEAANDGSIFAKINTVVEAILEEIDPDAVFRELGRKHNMDLSLMLKCGFHETADALRRGGRNDLGNKYDTLSGLIANERKQADELAEPRIRKDVTWLLAVLTKVAEKAAEIGLTLPLPPDEPGDEVEPPAASDSPPELF